MEGMIDRDGSLRIRRGGRMKIQECPFTSRDFKINDTLIHNPCGDWCPLFNEPIDEYRKSTGIWPEQNLGPTGRKLLSLCQNVLAFKQIIDERVTE